MSTKKQTVRAIVALDVEIAIPTLKAVLNAVGKKARRDMLAMPEMADFLRRKDVRDVLI